MSTLRGPAPIGRPAGDTLCPRPIPLHTASMAGRKNMGHSVSPPITLTIWRRRQDEKKWDTLVSPRNTLTIWRRRQDEKTWDTFVSPRNILTIWRRRQDEKHGTLLCLRPISLQYYAERKLDAEEKIKLHTHKKIYENVLYTRCVVLQ